MKCDYCGQESDEDICPACLWQVNPEESAYREARELGLCGDEARDYVEQLCELEQEENNNESRDQEQSV